MKTRFLNKRGGLVLAVLAGATASLLVLVASGCGGKTTYSLADLRQDTGGRIQATEKDYDFGDVPVNDQVEHDFQITNDGSGQLRIGQADVKRLQGC